MAEEVFDLYDREKLLLAEGQAILEHGSHEEIQTTTPLFLDGFYCLDFLLSQRGTYCLFADTAN